MIFEVDLTALPKGVRDNLHRIWSDENMVALTEAKIRQEKAKRFYEDNAPRWIDGFGPMVMAIDPYWRDYFRRKYGPDAESPEFQQWLAKREEMFRVKAVSPKTQVGYRAGAGGKSSAENAERGERTQRKEFLKGRDAGSRQSAVQPGRQPAQSSKGASGVRSSLERIGTSGTISNRKFQKSYGIN